MLPEETNAQSDVPSSEDRHEREPAPRARRVLGGRVVLTPDADMPYKVVLTYFDHEDTEHAFRTVREGEDFIRGEFPVPRGTSRPLRTPPS